ncbi:hypothetical protein M3221_24830 [Domibacillus indicus]|uniref:hypothetical protein n=1 Tax=Domibacillus indicus TaxID=1437523 RepID=UPI00203A6411|nr:hypothetical protein [Domibacillus indicus]MCM3791550.1 hypothetical protein [Domibacillus indicus]
MLQVNMHYVKAAAHHANELKKVLDIHGSYERRHREIKSVAHYIYLLKNRLDQEEDNAAVLSDWENAEKRARRSQRLINWDASEVAIKNEVGWLALMIERMELALSGIKPVLTNDEKQQFELEMIPKNKLFKSS